MILRVLTAVLFLVVCYFFPSSIDSDYTNLAKLRENTYFSSALVVAVLFFVRGWTAIFICIIEGMLITCNFYLAFNWQIRDMLFIGHNYSSIQAIAFYTELSIIALRLIIGLRKIGAELDSYYHRLASITGSTSNRERHK
jgi:hypothetical protein